MMQGPEPVVYLDLDGNGRTIILPRLLAMLPDGWEARPDQMRLETVNDRTRLLRVLDEVPDAAYVLLDTAQHLYGLTGRSQNKGDDWLDLFTELIRPLLARGCTVLILDHSARTASAAGPSGAHEKSDTGSAFEPEAAIPHLFPKYSG